MTKLSELRIGIGIHTTDMVPSQVYFNHIQTIVSWAKEFTVALFGVSRVKVARARNQILKMAIEEDCTHLLFLDSDHIVDKGMLALLVENEDAGMVSGLICKRGYPYLPIGFKFESNGDSLRQVVLQPNSGVLEVDGCAFGCTLINMKALLTLPTPQFYDTRTRRSDLNLCADMRKAGFRILVDTRVSVGHLGDPPVIFPGTSEELRKIEIEALLGAEEKENENVKV